MKNIVIISIIVLLSSCQTVNLAKKSDNTCIACYGYVLANCPTLAKQDSIYVDRLITVPGLTIVGTGNASQPCDTLVSNQAKGDTIGKPDVLISTVKDKKTGIEAKTTMNTGTGKIKTELNIPTQLIEAKFKEPCNCLFTDNDFKNYIKAKINHYWRNYRFWIIAALIAMMTIIVARAIKK